MDASVCAAGASFKLELEGPYLTSKDRALIREAGGGCPGRSDAADSDQRRFALSVATYVYHSQGSYEPSPLVHGGPIIAGANTPGRLKASWYPVQLRMPGTFRICYCAASDEVEFAESSGVVLGPNDSPCDLDYASYRLVGVAYAMGIKHSEAGLQQHVSPVDMMALHASMLVCVRPCVVSRRAVAESRCLRCPSVLAWCPPMVPSRAPVKFMFERTEAVTEALR